jgi:hypothetical protein
MVVERGREVEKSQSSQRKKEWMGARNPSRNKNEKRKGAARRFCDSGGLAPKIEKLNQNQNQS